MVAADDASRIPPASPRRAFICANCGVKLRLASEKTRDLQIDPWVHEAVARVLAAKGGISIRWHPAAQTSERTSSSDLWPYEEARGWPSACATIEPGRPVIFESGFGPSGLPHLGTMGEVLRPAYVRHAFQLLEPARPTRLIVFIDDMDGLRKVPENIPRREETSTPSRQAGLAHPGSVRMLRQSFAAHMIGLLGEFLAPVEVEYELMRSSEMYRSGGFDEGSEA